MFIYLFNKMIINNLHIFYLFIEWLVTMKFLFFSLFMILQLHVHKKKTINDSLVICNFWNHF
jgi:hypothetical protein